MRSLSTVLASLAAVLLATNVRAAPGEYDAVAQETAERYLKATTGEGSEDGKELLLGGVTMGAQLLELDNAKIESRDPVQHEEGSMASAVEHMQSLDRAGHEALSKLIRGGGKGDDLKVREVGKEEAAQLLKPTQERAKRFAHDHPVLAYCIRTDKEVYWHPKNPMRALLNQVGKQGTYTLDLYMFKVASFEGPNRFKRVWPLRVLRFRSGKVDTGWKVLPASDWSPDTN